MIDLVEILGEVVARTADGTEKHRALYSEDAHEDDHDAQHAANKQLQIAAHRGVPLEAYVWGCMAAIFFCRVAIFNALGIVEGSCLEVHAA